MNKQEQIKFIEDNYPLETHHISKRALRHSIFQNIETELQAYLLGFFAADGSINEKRKTLRIHLQKQDSEIVDLFKDIISPNAYTFINPEHVVTGRNGMKVHASESYGVDITSSQICNDLVSLGFGYNKTYKELHLPNIPKELLRHFIRGYFDGDGSFTGGVYQDKNRPNPRVRTHFNIDGKTISIFNDMLKLFTEENIKLNIIYLKRDNMYRLNTASIKTCKQLFHYLYDDANFYLKRKFNKFNYYVNTEVTQLIAEYRNAQEVNVNESNNPPKSVEVEKEELFDDDWYANNYFDYL